MELDPRIELSIEDITAAETAPRPEKINQCFIYLICHGFVSLSSSYLI